MNKKAKKHIRESDDRSKKYIYALHKTGVGCLYIKKLEDVDLKVLKGLIDTAVSRS